MNLLVSHLLKFPILAFKQNILRPRLPQRNCLLFRFYLEFLQLGPVELKLGDLLLVGLLKSKVPLLQVGDFLCDFIDLLLVEDSLLKHDVIVFLSEWDTSLLAETHFDVLLELQLP